MDDDIIKTDLLIVGAGPAGAALACFLASHGVCSPTANMLDSRD
jgi:2-polyprenyl-6-methoxyphenol hydroxylase-like FAD-dependent oxidoreductase